MSSGRHSSIPLPPIDAPRPPRPTRGALCAILRGLLFATVCAVAAGCAWLRPGERAAEAESRRLAEQAREMAAQGDSTRARELLARAMAANPDNAELHREQAKLLLGHGDCRSAVAHLQFAAAQSPADPGVLVELGVAYAAEQNWTAARRSAYSALDRDPRHVAALLLAAELAGRAGDDDEALALYHRALKERPHHSAARLGAAGVHLRRNRLARAAPLLRAVGQDNEACPADRARACRELGEALAREERWVAAREALAAVVEFDGEVTADDWYRLAAVQHQLGEAQTARTSITRALLLAPQHGPALELAASLETGRPPGASPILQAGHTWDASASQ